MRTDQEILDRIVFMRKHDTLQMTLGELSGLLPLEALKSMLNPRLVRGIEERGVLWQTKPRDEESIKKKMLEYLPYAWKMANVRSEINCACSILHFANWFWLLGDDDMAAYLLRPYTFFGKPQLVAISEKMGFDWEKVDDGEWLAVPGDVSMTPAEAMKL